MPAFIPSPSLPAAFLVALAVALATTPLFRRLARSVGLVDKPAARKVHTVAIPYLGGMAVAAGTLAGLLLAPGRDLRLGVVALVAVVLCVLGLLDDDRQLPPAPRLAVELAAALVTVALGLRLGVTGIAVVDGALTVVWIVGLTNAVNLLDNMDGLGAGVAGSVAVSSLVLMLALPGRADPALAVAVVGACLGFLAFNKRPASIYMGDAGSLFLGYLISVLTLVATRSLAPAPRLVVPLLLAAVPLADTATVVMARLRRGISPAEPGKDHLSHRLVRRGLPPGPAVAVLVGTSFLVGLLGALAGRGALPLAAAGALAVLPLGLLLWVVLPVRVYEAPVVGLPRVMRWVGAAVPVAAALAWRWGLLPVSGGRPGALSERSADLGAAAASLVVLALVLLAGGLAVVVSKRRRSVVAPTADGRAGLLIS